jgi:ribosomal protein S18 acetylase RimI-like enzyme
MAGTESIRIAALPAADYETAIPGLAALLVDAVDGGASVNFLAGVDEAMAAGWWRVRIGAVADGTISPFVAFDGERVVGSVLLIRSPNPNSPHRAEIAKVIVHRSVRRRGLGTALMSAAEAAARVEGRWLLVLDTETGGAAEAFYRSAGWHEAGTIPNYALLTDGTPAPATWYWKDLR